MGAFAFGVLANDVFRTVDGSTIPPRRAAEKPQGAFIAR